MEMEASSLADTFVPRQIKAKADEALEMLKKQAASTGRSTQLRRAEEEKKDQDAASAMLGLAAGDGDTFHTLPDAPPEPTPNNNTMICQKE